MATQLTICASQALISLARAEDGDDIAHDDELQLDALITKAADNAWFRAFEASRYAISLKEGNAIARVILEAHADGEDANAALIQSCLLGRNDAWAAAREVASEILNAHDDDLQDLTRTQYSQLRCRLAERIEPILLDADTSTPADAFSSGDRAEILFVISPTGKHALDASICNHRPWPDYGELYVTEDLVHALAALGYTLGDYRKHSGNRHVSERPRGKTRIMRPPFPRPHKPLCSLEAIREMVDNSCATHFLFVLYAMVPIAQLIDLDPTKSVTFSKAAIATWNPWDGTFHDAVSVPDVTVTPKMGTLMSAAGYYSPDSICGFVHSYYHSDIANPAATPGNAEAKRFSRSNTAAVVSE